jgi:hypothetical protein
VYSNPIYYILLTTSFISFCIWIYNIREAKKINNIQLVDITTVDNKGYWMYNNKLYCGDIQNNSINGKDVIEINTFGMTPKEVQDMVRNFR